MFETALAIVGKNGSGKTTLSDYLASLGFSIYSLSDVVRDEVRRLGRSEDRDTLTSTANDMKREGGLSVFAEKVYDKAVAEQATLVVFDSVRNIKEVESLKAKGVVVIGVEADLKVRYERIKSRKRATDMIDFETFKAQDERENSGASFGQNIKEALDSCSVVLSNDKDLEALCSDMDEVLTRVVEMSR